MVEVELALRGDPIDKLEALVGDLGLTIHRGTHKKYPGCTHWHFTKPGDTGTLEATWHPLANRLWLCAHSNRMKPWVEEAMLAIREGWQERKS